MQYVYKFYNNKDECLYVGKTNCLAARFSQHKRDKLWFNEVDYIMYARCPKEFMIDIYEIYYINTLSPKYNRKDINIKHIDFCYDKLKFKKYDKFKKENLMDIKHCFVDKVIYGENNVTKDVHFLQISNKVEVKSTTNHHILLADCSGSMRSYIQDLKENIKKVADTLLSVPNSYLSVITYSGHGESKRILSAIKCDNVTYKMNNVYNMIDEDIFVQGITVMSEPLEKSIDICKNLVDVCQKNHIVLFTDGCLVPMRWSVSTESNKCFEVAKICKKQGIFLDAVGFGQYYDRKFLNQLVNIAGNGYVNHIDYINDYYNMIIKSIENINNSNMSKVEILTDGLCINLKNGIVSNELTIYGNNILIAIINDTKTLLNGENVDYLKLSDIPIKEISQILTDYKYCLAKYHLENEDIDNYEYIVKDIGDISLYEKTQNCCSFTEKGKALNVINELIKSKQFRFANGFKDFKQSNDVEPMCFLEIIEEIVKDNDSQLYWDTETPYHRITQKQNSNEDNIRFTRISEGLIPVNNISISNEKLNISVNVPLEGIVSDSISGAKLKANIFRQYNLINGGNINIPYINAKLSDRVLKDLEPLNILSINNKYSIPNVVNIYKIDLSGIKTANKRILKSISQENIKNYLLKINELYCEQYAVNKRIKELLGDSKKIDISNLSPEEIELHKLLRVDENGIYMPKSISKDDTTPFDVYPAVYMTWEVKTSETKLKKFYIEKYSGVSDINNLIKTQTDIRIGKRNLEFLVNSVRIAAALMNKTPFFFDSEIEKEKTVTDNILNINTIVDGLINERKKIMDDNILVQQKWLQMIKCN